MRERLFLGCHFRFVRAAGHGQRVQRGVGVGHSRRVRRRGAALRGDSVVHSLQNRHAGDCVLGVFLLYLPMRVFGGSFLLPNRTAKPSRWS